MSKSPKNSTDLSNELNMAIGCAPSCWFCKNAKPEVSAYSSNWIPYALGLITISPFTFNGYVNEISLLVISMFSEPVKLVFVNNVSTYVLS